nr:MAG TPA: hypothetical protein [Caudoviricetes sp.]DAQ49234.1 MAG TPA: hypothetical protein [Caudoviricetes sp.]
MYARLSELSPMQSPPLRLSSVIVLLICRCVGVTSCNVSVPW